MGHLEQKLSKFEEEAHNQMQALEYVQNFFDSLYLFTIILSLFYLPIFFMQIH